MNPELERRRTQIESQILRLLKHGVRVEDVALVLDAEEFLIKKPEDKKGGALAHFDVARFVSRELSKLSETALPDEIHTLDEVIIPPDDRELELFNSGRESAYEKSKIIPRTTYLRELLSDMKVSYTVYTGIVAKNMMRGMSYVIFAIPEKRKIVFVNDEEGNRTFIIHDVEPTERVIRTYVKHTKEELKSLELSNKISHTIWHGDPDRWKEVLKSEINTPGAPNNNAQAREAEDQDNDPRDEIPEAGEDERNLKSLSDELGVARGYIQTILAKLLETHPEMEEIWIQERRVPETRNTADYFTAPLLALIRADVEETMGIPEPGKDERTASRLGIELEADGTTIKRILKIILKENPDKKDEWIQERREPGSARLNDYFTAPLVALMRAEIKKIKKTPEAGEDERTIKALADEIGIVRATLREMAKNLIKENPGKKDEWIQERKEPGRMYVQDYYTAPLVELLRAEIKKIKKTPEPEKNERNITRLVDELKLNLTTIKKIVKRLLKVNPGKKDEWIQERRMPGSVRTYDYFTAPLVELLRAEAQRIKEIPEAGKDERTRRSMANELSVTEATMKVVVANLLKQNPGKKDEWIQERRVPEGNRVLDYYTAPLVELIRGHVEETKKIPEAGKDERSLKSLSTELKVTRDYIQKVLRKLLKARPEMKEIWIQERRVPKTLNTLDYFTAPLVELVRADVEETKKIPEAGKDEMTNKATADELGMDGATIKKIVKRLLKENPGKKDEWIQERRVPGSIRVLDYYTAPFIALLRKEVTKKKES